MIVKILREFYDKNNVSHLFKVGDEVEFADSRARDIISRGLGECVTKETPVEAPAEETDEKVEEAIDETPAEETADEAPAEVVEETPKVEAPVRRRGRQPRS